MSLQAPYFVHKTKRADYDTGSGAAYSEDFASSTALRTFQMTLTMYKGYPWLWYIRHYASIHKHGIWVAPGCCHCGGGVVSDSRRPLHRASGQVILHSLCLPSEDRLVLRSRSDILSVGPIFRLDWYFFYSSNTRQWGNSYAIVGLNSCQWCFSQYIRPVA